LASDTTSQHWLSTKGLSVHTALRRAGRPLTVDELVTALRVWREDVTEEYVEHGIAYLAGRGFISERDGAFASARPVAQRLKRVNGDRDLDWA